MLQPTRDTRIIVRIGIIDNPADVIACILFMAALLQDFDPPFDYCL